MRLLWTVGQKSRGRNRAGKKLSQPESFRATWTKCLPLFQQIPDRKATERVFDKVPTALPVSVGRNEENVATLGLVGMAGMGRSPDNRSGLPFP